MFDAGSYRSAIRILEDGDGARPRPPSYQSATSQSYSRPSRKSSSHHSHQELDGDWLSVPVDGGRKRTQATSLTRRGHRDDSSRVLDDDDWLPVSNGVSSRSMGYNINSGRPRSTENILANDSGYGYDESYTTQMHRAPGRTIFSGGAERRSHQVPSRSENSSANSFLPKSKREGKSRSSSRLIYDGEMDTARQERSLRIPTNSAPREKKFLSDVQKELEHQRLNWKEEIEKMSGSTISGEVSSTIAMKSSYVDTSGIEPRFKAFIDVSEFPPSSVTVNVDKLSDKIVVEAQQVSRVGSVARTFTQKVQLPRFADDTRLSARMNRDGILKVEVPLIYYFPDQEESGQKTKSFVYKVHKNDDGSRTMEIIVKPGKDLSFRDLRVELSDDELIVFAEKPNGVGTSQKIIIKKYTLPENSDVEGITSTPTADGCLTIHVPIYERRLK